MKYCDFYLNLDVFENLNLLHILQIPTIFTIEREYCSKGCLDEKFRVLEGVKFEKKEDGEKLLKIAKEIDSLESSGGLLFEYRNFVKELFNGDNSKSFDDFSVDSKSYLYKKNVNLIGHLLYLVGELKKSLEEVIELGYQSGGGIEAAKVISIFLTYLRDWIQHLAAISTYLGCRCGFVNKLFYCEQINIDEWNGLIRCDNELINAYEKANFSSLIEEYRRFLSKFDKYLDEDVVFGGEKLCFISSKNHNERLSNLENLVKLAIEEEFKDKLKEYILKPGEFHITRLSIIFKLAENVVKRLYNKLDFNSVYKDLFKEKELKEFILYYIGNIYNTSSNINQHEELQRLARSKPIKYIPKELTGFAEVEIPQSDCFKEKTDKVAEDVVKPSENVVEAKIKEQLEEHFKYLVEKEGLKGKSKEHLANYLKDLLEKSKGKLEEKLKEEEYFKNHPTPEVAFPECPSFVNEVTILKIKLESELYEIKQRYEGEDVNEVTLCLEKKLKSPFEKHSELFAEELKRKINLGTDIKFSLDEEKPVRPGLEKSEEELLMKRLELKIPDSGNPKEGFMDKEYSSKIKKFVKEIKLNMEPGFAETLKLLEYILHIIPYVELSKDKKFVPNVGFSVGNYIGPLIDKLCGFHEENFCSFMDCSQIFGLPVIYSFKQKDDHYYNKYFARSLLKRLFNIDKERREDFIRKLVNKFKASLQYCQPDGCYIEKLKESFADAVSGLEKEKKNYEGKTLTKYQDVKFSFLYKLFKNIEAVLNEYDNSYIKRYNEILDSIGNVIDCIANKIEKLKELIGGGREYLDVVNSLNKIVNKLEFFKSNIVLKGDKKEIMESFAYFNMSILGLKEGKEGVEYSGDEDKYLENITFDGVVEQLDRYKPSV